MAVFNMNDVGQNGAGILLHVPCASIEWCLPRGLEIYVVTVIGILSFLFFYQLVSVPLVYAIVLQRVY